MRGKPFSTWRWVAIGLLPALVVFGGPSAGAATLRWKFQPGETLHYVMDQKTKTAVKAGGPQDLKSTMSQTIDMEWAVKDVDGDGQASLTQTITRVRTKIESGLGAAFEFDSKDPKDPEGPIGTSIAPLLRALVGAEFAFKMNSQGELSDVKVPSKVLDSLKKTGTLGGAAGMFSEEGLKNMVTESSLALPKEELEKGKSWTRQTKIPMAPIGAMTLDKTYSYQGASPKDGKTLERIDLDTKVDFQLAPGDTIEVKIQAQEGKGSFFFDNKSGRIADSSVSEKLEMLFKLKVGDQQKEVVQVNETSTTMKLVPGPAGDGGEADSSKK